MAARSIVVVGCPTALGGHFAGMERGPAELRAHGLLDRLAARPGFGFGATAAMCRNERDFNATVDAVATLSAAALGGD